VSVWDRLRGRGARRLEPALAARLAAWRALPAPDAKLAANRSRLVVADVETTGLDVTRDHLVAIGAVAVVGGAIALEDSFEVTLRQAAPSSDDNILVHRIRGDEQLHGTEPAEALVAFLEFVGNAPLVGFHAHFDELMLARAYAVHLGEKIPQTWLDLRELGPALASAGEGGKAPAAPPGLDDWLAREGIVIRHRHHATADAFGTAQLLQTMMARAAAAGYATIAQLHQLARDAKWLRTP
jgi:DNA polymerase III subunit epsilon